MCTRMRVMRVNLHTLRCWLVDRIQAVGYSLTFLAACLTVLLQIIVWLKTGEWADGSLKAALYDFDLSGLQPTTTWIGINQVVDWAFDLHVFFWVLLVGGLTTFILAVLVDPDS